jgi:hypothetical protein
LRDVSPEFPLEYIHEPFHYGLRPGQGIVLVTRRGRRTVADGHCQGVATSGLNPAGKVFGSW